MRCLVSCLMVAVCCLSIGCETPTAKTVYVQEDAKVLAAFQDQLQEGSKQTDLLAQLVRGQDELIRALEDKRIGVGAMQVSLPPEDVTADEEPEEKGPQVKAADDAEGWPSDIRLQVWKDGSAEGERWLKEELPLLDTAAEEFESFGYLANKHRVSGFTVTLVKDGIVERRYPPPESFNTSASQILLVAKAIAAGKNVGMTGLGDSCKCRCPNCSCEFDCQCTTSSGTTSGYTSLPSVIGTESWSPLPSVSYGPWRTVNSPLVNQSSPMVVRPNYAVRSSSRVRCVNGKCYTY